MQTTPQYQTGETKIVTITDIAGEKVIHGGNSLATGPVDRSRLPQIIANLQSLGFAHEKLGKPLAPPSPHMIDRRRYADAYGPTTGDRVRLADTDLYIEIENDFTVYGDECVFGGGKVIREGMGQATGLKEGEALDLVITNAVIVDWSGIYKVGVVVDVEDAAFC